MGVKRRYSVGVTAALSSIPILLMLAAIFWGPRNAAMGLDRPVVTAILYHEAMLTMAAGSEPDAWGGARGWVMPMRKQPLVEAIDAYKAALAEFDGAETSDRVALEARLAVALVAAGRIDEAKATFARLKGLSSSGDAIAKVVEYGMTAGPERPSSREVEDAFATLGRHGAKHVSWSADQLRLACLRRGLIANESDGSPDAFQARASTLAQRADAWSLFLLASIGLGLVGLAIAVGRGSPAFRRISDAPLPPPWSMAEGWSAFIRALICAFLVLLAGAFWFEIFRIRVDAVAWLLAGVPGYLFLRAGLLRPHGLSYQSAFGLTAWLPAGALVSNALALMALELGLGWLGEAALSIADYAPPWTESLWEELIHGSLADVVSSLVTGVVLAPLLEEIAFRGLLYGTLRTKLTRWPAAIVSAGAFAIIHGYSVVGTTFIFIGAVASALVYERTRSLLPCIIAHAANNLLALSSNLILR